MRYLFSLATFSTMLIVASSPAQDSAGVIIPTLGIKGGSGGPDFPDKKFEDFEKVVKGAKVVEGLYKLYQKDEHVYMEIRPEQLNRPVLLAGAIAKGAGLGGYTLNFDEQWAIVFKRIGDKIFVIRRNVRFQARNGSPVARAVDTTYSDSVLFAVPIRTINMNTQGALIDLNTIFFTDLMNVGSGFLDTNRTTWHKLKGFPKNVEMQVAAVFSGRYGDDSVIDPRGTTMVLHYSLMELPEFGYMPRIADDRVGYFLTAIKDFTDDTRDTAYVRYINRWRLERADGSPWKEGGKLVPPKKKIVFWIENSVPDEYRAAVREGILEWNKAFEKIGFRDAIEVRQQEGEDFDPEDVNYNTFRWIATDQGFAMGPSRANPLTGEILDADIIFDASMVRYYKMEAQLYKTAIPGLFVTPPEAARLGLDPELMPHGKGIIGWNDRAPTDAAERAKRHALAIRQGLCSCIRHKQSELGLALAVLQQRAEVKPGEKLPDEMIQQAIKEVVMHEVGHTLGLRHNFKASTMLKNEQLHDTTVTRKQGLVGSVMDYTPINFAPKGVKQGDYFTSTIGPYDYWAIEYGYKPLNGGTEGEVEELKKIAARAATPGFDYGTDEDVFGTSDPHINRWDLGADPMKFGMDRAALADELLKGLADRVVNKGEGWQRTRTAFEQLLGEYARAAYFVGQFIGGEHYYRDHKGDAGGRDPFVPVTGAKQREALKFLQEKILTDAPFQFSPELLRKLAADRWMHWGTEWEVMSGVEYPIYDMILGIQRTALRNLLNGGTLSRLQAIALKADKDDNPLTIAEVFRATTDSIFADLPNGEKAAVGKSSIIRRNLQREYLKRLSRMVIGESRSGGFLIIILFGGGGDMPPDAKSLARMHLREIGKRIDQLLADKKATLDETIKAHLEESKEVISKVLSAGLQANEP